MKKLLSIILSAILTVGSLVVPAVLVHAEDSDVLRVFINGNEVQLEMPPVLTDKGEIMISVCSLAKVIGDEVMWNGETNSMAIKHGRKVLIAKAGADQIYYC